MGKLLILAGLGLLAVGLVVHFFPNASAWFGRLPGDIRIETESSKVHIPITSMIVVSLVLTLLVNVLLRK